MAKAKAKRGDGQEPKQVWAKMRLDEPISRRIRSTAILLGISTSEVVMRMFTGISDEELLAQVEEAAKWRPGGAK